MPASPPPSRGSSAGTQRKGGQAQSAKENECHSKPLLAKVLARFKDFSSGRQLGAGYQRGPHLSSGADGDVFRAAEELPDGAVRDVAIKHMRTTSATVQRHAAQEVAAVFLARQRYMEESGHLDSVGHPNIVAYLDWFGSDRELFLVMERCDFALSDMLYTIGSMRSQYERRFNEVRARMSVCGTGGGMRSAAVAAAPDAALFRLTEGEITKVMYELLSALAFLNRHGILHRDVKSDNILWKRLPGEARGRYKLADFGVAASGCTEDEPKFEKSCGTLWTMAPEVLANKPHGANCDVWSLGIVLFEVAILEKPFTTKDLLAYKNSFEAHCDGKFWHFVSELGGASAQPGTAPGKPKSVPGTPARRGTICTMSATVRRPMSPAGTRCPESPASGGRGRMPEPVSPTRANSVPALPRVRNGLGAKRCVVSGVAVVPPAFSPTAAAAFPTAATTLRLLPASEAPAAEPQTSALLGDSSGVGGGGRRSPRLLAGGGGCASDPPSPHGGAVSTASARKWAFLRRRCNNRWFYGHELRSLLFDVMLEEDPSVRPTASDLLAGHRAAAEGAAELAVLPSASEAPEVAGLPLGAALAQLLKHATGEAFLAATLLPKEPRSDSDPPPRPPSGRQG